MIKAAQRAFVVLGFSASAAGACPDFGLSSEYLSQYFCAELGEISGLPTRSADLDGYSTSAPGDVGAGSDALAPPTPEWLDLPVVQEAWRSDPAQTLRLIERIRAAGGRPIK